VTTCSWSGRENRAEKKNVADEDRRQLHRKLQELKDERTGHVNRIKGLLASQGLTAPEIDKKFAEWLKQARLWDGTAVPQDLQRRLLRELEHWQLVDRHITELEHQRRQQMRRDDTPDVDKARRLLGLWAWA
jgi:transposase